MTYPNQQLVDSLKHRARQRCEGCRLSWRLDGWQHREPMPITCKAQQERQQLRDIASAAKAVSTEPEFVIAKDNIDQTWGR